MGHLASGLGWRSYSTRESTGQVMAATAFAPPRSQHINAALRAAPAAVVRPNTLKKNQNSAQAPTATIRMRSAQPGVRISQSLLGAPIHFGTIVVASVAPSAYAAMPSIAARDGGRSS